VVDVEIVRRVVVDAERRDTLLGQRTDVRAAAAASSR